MTATKAQFARRKKYQRKVCGVRRWRRGMTVQDWIAMERARKAGSAWMSA